jgi:hypothetical protein
VVGSTSLTRFADIERQRAQHLILQLRKHGDVNEDHFVFLAATPYQVDFVRHLKHYEAPIEGLRFGLQLQPLGCQLL